MLKSSAALSTAALIGSLGSRAVHAQGSDEIRIGLIGCGGRGTGAAQNALEASKGVKLTALADVFPDQLETARKLFAAKAEKDPQKFAVKAEQCFVGLDAYKKLLETDVNYVILATPPGFRPIMIEAAINAGKHVFAEKPVAVDPAGCRRIIAAGKVAAEKKLGLVVGTQRRHERSYMETIKRIHDGAIGDLVSGQGYWLQGSLWVKHKEPQWSETEWQIRNWLYFLWLSGDHIVEQHLHQIDVMNWIFKVPPRLAHGVGGRMVRTGPEYGHIYDFFAIEFEYPVDRNVARVLSMCRQIDQTRGLITEQVQGTKGSAIAKTTLFDASGKRAWKYEPPEDLEDGQDNPYMLEHRDLIESIRAGKPLNEAQQAADSTIAAIMGRTAAYTGKLITYKAILDDPTDTFPKHLDLSGPMPTPPVPLPGVGGRVA
jgi:predicted dehydrogenase